VISRMRRPVLLASRVRERTPHGESAGDVPEVLPEGECLRLLRTQRVGRVALADRGQPLIFPVNYAADERAIVFRTAPGQKLHVARMSSAAFEVDHVDEQSGVAWSVVVKGVAYEITDAIDELSDELRRLVVEPMAPGERTRWIAIRRHETSGRRFRLPAAAVAAGH